MAKPMQSRSAIARGRVEAGLARRHRREGIFRAAGLAAMGVGLLFLAVFLATLVERGASAFTQTVIELEVVYAEEILAPYGELDLAYADYGAIVRDALLREFPDVTERRERRELARLVSTGATWQLQEAVASNPELVGSRQRVTVPASADVDMLMKGNLDRGLPEAERALSDRQIAWVDRLAERELLHTRFNTSLFTHGDSRDPEVAGIRGALAGSFLMLTVTIAVSFPVGAAAAIYLEEFAPRNRWTDLIEVNINNLAAVPSIVFGLLALAVFINWLGMPRSSPLVGGLALSLLTLPVIIIASRAAIRAVPPSIRDAAFALGASRLQVVSHHVLPLALPGMLTGAIIGMSRALGETAPLLMIGMVAFIVDVPGGFTEPATALPVQIFLWSDSPERAFAEKTAAAILVLLGFLLLMNLAAVLMRRKLERRW